MFQPTHLLVTRSRKTPVRLEPKAKGYAVYTEQDWQQQRQPAFEFHSKLGLFCRGIQLVGHSLEPMAAEVPTAEATAAAQR